jgi:FHA domain
MSYQADDWRQAIDFPDILEVRLNDGNSAHGSLKRIYGGTAFVGRYPFLRLTTSVADVSQCHARITWDEKTRKYKIFDEYSTCGSKLNGRTIPRGLARNLKSGDVVRLGATAELRIEVGTPIDVKNVARMSCDGVFRKWACNDETPGSSCARPVARVAN